MIEDNPKPSSVTNNTQYLVVTVVMFAVGMGSVILVSVMRPLQDNTLLITTIIGFTGTTLASVLGFMKAQETHASVNSRMDEFIKKFEATSIIKQDKARVEGLSDGRKEGRDLANQRTDEIASHAIYNPPAVVPVVEPLLEIQKNTKETAEVLKEIKDK